ncbi:TonB-dependent receptor plug domain-containing protein [Tamlana fucoidanivorans]|uniref:TonB-dependent receptor plug domain-containing protein n=1 Tax=Allotamlana fucoidanivorans TaxID=2583814 RepID=A0A5C4SGQ5_9FLAO|nr:TonB-dependent receptor plug domain-containing protein [Tamlana fucoidanivorans]TNJ42593.1 hypothetical protein FGF67_13965 [Tamlana fucoidanivorans]
MTKNLILGLLAFFLLSFSLQTRFRELVFEKLDNYTNQFPEKIYVQTDKPYYALGDDIWFTAYLVNGVTHTRSSKSRVIYVELINEQDSIVSKRRLYTNDVSVAGDFKIDKELKAGNYLLRAYTSYMRNNGSADFFLKELPIWNINKEQQATASLSTPVESNKPNAGLKTKPELSFYPEGGNLIEELFSKMAVKVKDPKGRNIAITGEIKDSNHNTVASFTTHDYGLGLITYTPAPNISYYASIYIDNQEVKYPLPQALPRGYQLSVSNFGHQIVIKVSSSSNMSLKNTFLVGHQRGELIYEKLETQDSKMYTVKLSTELLSDGVTNFTLFDSNSKPICERLVFIDNPNNDIAVNLKLSKANPKTRDKVKLAINLKNKDSLPIFGNLSMSITDIDAIGQSTKNGNIKTYLLLNSDLRGTIENPGYFFEKANDPRRRYTLDLVMLSHGWRRFKWTDLLYSNNAYKDTFSPEKGIFISGRTKELRGKKQQISAATRLTFMTKPPYQDKQQADSTGLFKYGPFVFSDSVPTLIEARVKDFKSDEDRKNRFVSIILEDALNSSPRVSRNDLFKPFLKDTSRITNFMHQARKMAALDSIFLREATRLDEVVITARRQDEKEKRNLELNERTNYGYPSNRIDMAEMENLRNLSILDLLNMLPGVTAYNDSISIRRQGSPKIVVDGIPAEMADILYMTGNDVDFIDVLKGADAVTFSNAGNGVIAVYTRTGNFSQNIHIKRKPGIIDFTAKGFYSAREFYAPDHINGFDEATRQDIRTTLHWEPKIVLNTNRPQGNISFFTSDLKSNYAIRIEGLSENGQPFSHLSYLKVH